MTFIYNNVYLNEVSTVTGPYEKSGLLGSYFDYSYDDLYFGENTWEEAESASINEAINILLSKAKLTTKNIDLIISGDLLNQLTASNYAVKNIPVSFIGIYAACATSTLGLIMASNIVESTKNKKIICTTSSHNNAAEKQFRYPVEYGGPKPKTTTFTSTGAAGALISNKISNIKITSGTIGKVIDSGINDVFNMGGVMATSAADTIYNHLKNTKRKVSDYDLILTGDLGIYGKQILKEYMLKEYNISLDNYDDAGTMLYDLNKYAGASGPACLPLVTYSYILRLMKKGKLNRVLLVATGALMSQVTGSQKRTIPAIAHAVSLEAVR